MQYADERHRLPGFIAQTDAAAVAVTASARSATAHVGHHVTQLLLWISRAQLFGRFEDLEAWIHQDLHFVVDAYLSDNKAYFVGALSQLEAFTESNGLADSIGGMSAPVPVNFGGAGAARVTASPEHERKTSFNGEIPSLNGTRNSNSTDLEEAKHSLVVGQRRGSASPAPGGHLTGAGRLAAIVRRMSNAKMALHKTGSGGGGGGGAGVGSVKDNSRATATTRVQFDGFRAFDGRGGATDREGDEGGGSDDENENGVGAAPSGSTGAAAQRTPTSAREPDSTPAPPNRVLDVNAAKATSHRVKFVAGSNDVRRDSLPPALPAFPTAHIGNGGDAEKRPDGETQPDLGTSKYLSTGSFSRSADGPMTLMADVAELVTQGLDNTTAFSRLREVGHPGKVALGPGRGSTSSAAEKKEESLTATGSGDVTPSPTPPLPGGGEGDLDDALRQRAAKFQKRVMVKPMSLREQHSITTRKSFYTKEQEYRHNYLKRAELVSHVFADLWMVVIIVNIFLIGAQIGLGGSNMPYWVLIVEAIIDTICFLALAVNFYLPFEEKGQMVTDRKRVVKRYLLTPNLFLFDLLSTFPVLLVMFAAGTSEADMHYGRANLLLRTLMFRHLYPTLQLQFPNSVHPSVWRLGSYVAHLFFAVTFLTMTQLIVIRVIGHEHAVEWLEAEIIGGSVDGNSFLLFGKIWHLQLINVADKKMPYPQSDLEVAWATCAVFVALVVIVVIIATVEEIVVDIIQRSTIVSRKIEEVQGALEGLGAPEELKDEVVAYYQRMWDLCKSFDFNTGDDQLTDLPDLLRTEIDFASNSRIICTIPLFEALVTKNEGFARSMVGDLHHCVILPGVPIVTKGEVGDCMFLMSAGDAAVLGGASGHDVVKMLEAGSFFGEVTMLFGGNRPCTIVAVTLCVCYVVTDTQFEELMLDYPEALEVILRSGVEHMRRKQLALKAAKAAAAQNPAAVPYIAAEGELAHITDDAPTGETDADVDARRVEQLRALFEQKTGADAVTHALLEAEMPAVAPPSPGGFEGPAATKVL